MSKLSGLPIMSATAQTDRQLKGGKFILDHRSILHHHRGSQGQQGSWLERYTEKGIEASSQAIGFPPSPYLQRVSPRPSSSPNVKARSSDLCP